MAAEIDNADAAGRGPGQVMKLALAVSPVCDQTAARVGLPPAELTAELNPFGVAPFKTATLYHP